MKHILTDNEQNVTQKYVRWLAAVVLAMSLILATGLLAGGQNEPAKPAVDPAYESFRMVIDRNIFNPQRNGKPGGEVKVASSADDYIDLLGALITSEGALAIFEGSETEYNAILRSAQTLAGMRLTEIGTDQVRLQQGDRQLDLPVGYRLSRSRGGAWEVGDGPLTEIAHTTGTQVQDSTGSAGDTKEIEAPADEVTKKLMEKRRRELGQ